MCRFLLTFAQQTRAIWLRTFLRDWLVDYTLLVQPKMVLLLLYKVSNVKAAVFATSIPVLSLLPSPSGKTDK